MGGMNGMPGAEGTESDSSVLTVQIEKPTIGNIYLVTELVGTVEPEKTSDVYPKGSGTVTAVYFEVGDYVEEGQTLITIDSDSLASAEISIESAQMQLENAQT